MTPEDKKQSHLIIPCHWNAGVLDAVLLNNNQANIVPVGEVYGVLADGGPVGHGRSRSSVVELMRDDAISFRKNLRERGLNFTYLLNAPFRLGNDSSRQQALDGYLDWILSDLSPDALMISSHELMRYVRDRGSNTPIHISTIAGVKTVEDLERFIDIEPSVVVPHHDAGRRWSDLGQIVDFGRNHGIDCELMVTESCVFGCSMRHAHYEYLAGRDNDKPFHLTCNADKLINPREFLLAGGTVRPEDLAVYEDMGINRFKITGRSKPADWLPEVVRAYGQRAYEGNFIRLLGIDPSMSAEDWIYLNNKALNGFLSGFPRTAIYTDEVGYCEEWITKLYRNGDFALLDGSSYSPRNNSLTIDDLGGSRAASIIHREKRTK